LEPLLLILHQELPARAVANASNVMTSTRLMRTPSSHWIRRPMRIAMATSLEWRPHPDSSPTHSHTAPRASAPQKRSAMIDIHAIA